MTFMGPTSCFISFVKIIQVSISFLTIFTNLDSLQILSIDYTGNRGSRASSDSQGAGADQELQLESGGRGGF